MQYLSLKVLTEDVPLVAPLLAKRGVFNPEMAEVAVVEQLPEQPGDEFRRVFHSARSRLEKILARISFTPPVATDAYRVIELKELAEIDARLGQLWLQLSKLEEQLHQFNEQQTVVKQLLETLQKFTQLDLDLRVFQEQKRFLNLHIGIIPAENLEHFQAAIALAEHFINIFHTDEQSVYLVIAGPLEHQDQVRAVLEHADFQPLTIPPQFHSYPQQVHVELTEQMTQLQQQINAISATIQALAAQNQTLLEQSYQTLEHAAAYATLTDTLSGRGQLTLITGWMPAADLPKLEADLNEQFNRPLVLTHRQPSPSEYAQVPSLIRHHRWLAPYVALVKNYGTPRYGEFDPTLLLTVTFILMFGTMFGDVGHGAVIAGIGWYWRHQLTRFTPFFLAAGLSSMVFGFLYGSIFGFEEVLLPALWMSPIHNPILMLTIALYWGMGFILLVTLINIMNRWNERNYLAAWFDHTGIVGILLYLGGFYAARQWMITQSFETDQQLAVLLPLLVILTYKWHENKLPLGERLLVTLVEGFESLLNYLSNTLSFLRVAAFSLNHAALAIAVFTLANMMAPVVDWLVIILGNLFIVVLEGAIVTIQVLRLEYYEGFSRFFSGDGRAFRPLTRGLNQKQ